MKDFDSTKQLGEFGRLTLDKFDETYLQLIKSDIDRSQTWLPKIPENARRGLTLDTLAHFHCGWLTDWVNTKNRAEWICGKRTGDDGKPKPLAPPSRRIIVPTPDLEHFNAIIPPADRKAGDDKWCKIHAGKKNKLFYDDKSLKKCEIVAVVEGEIDAMSIWQATNGRAAAIAILGRSNWNNAFVPQLQGRLKGKKFILMFDKDDGQIDSDKLRQSLINMGVPAVSKYFYDALTDDDKKSFGNKVDANAILQKRGDKFLKTLLEKIYLEARLNLKAVEEELSSRNLFAQPAAHEQSPNHNDNPNKDEIKKILSYIPANKLDREKWITVGMILKRYGFSLEDFKDWSKDDSRYDAARCEADWDSFWTKGENKGKGHTVATLVMIAKEFGYIQHGKPKNQAPLTDVDKKLGEWQTLNGLIAPDVLTKLKDAKTYLDALTPDNITPQIIQSSKTKNALALCLFYDAYADSAINFYANVDSVKAKAVDDIKTLKAAGGDFIAIPADLTSKAQITTTALKKDVEKLKNACRKAHKQFLRQEEARLAKEKYERAKELRVIEITNAKDRLKQLQAQPQSDERDAEIISCIRELCDWQHNKFGDPVCIKDTQENANIIFHNDPAIFNLIGYDQFYNTTSFTKNSPWYSETKKGDRWSDTDDALLRVYLRSTYKEFGTKEKLIYDAVAKLAAENAFHPIREHFKSLAPWDGKKRAETLFIDWLGVPDTPLNREITLNWLTAAVARVFNPGCIYQTALVLPGNQGVGKSYILERLGYKKWYGSLTDKLTDLRALESIQTKWVVEMEEGDAWSKADVAAQKRFISGSQDTYRSQYARNATDKLRQCVIAITLNGTQFLSDPTGNRRYMVLESTRTGGDYITEVRGEHLTDDNIIDQIWAEVFAHYNELFKDGFDAKKLELSPEARRQIEINNEKYVRDDGITGEIQASLDAKILPDVIWSLLGKDDRREFFKNSGVFSIEEEELKSKFQAAHKRINPALQDEFDNAIALCPFVHRSYVRDKKSGEVTTWLKFFGTVYRQHISAAEIKNEFFDKGDRRVTFKRIHEVLNKIEGWTLGKRIARASAYGNQPNVYYRDVDNIPQDDEPEVEPAATTEESTTVTTENYSYSAPANIPIYNRPTDVPINLDLIPDDAIPEFDE